MKKHKHHMLVDLPADTFEGKAAVTCETSLKTFSQNYESDTTAADSSVDLFV